MSREASGAGATSGPPPQSSPQDSLERLAELLIREREEQARSRRWWKAGAVAAAVLAVVLIAVNAALIGYLWARSQPPAAGSGAAGEAPAGAAGPVYEPPSRGEAHTSGRIRVGRSDDTNDVVVTVDAVEFRQSGTRLWLTVENRRTEPVQFMAGATAALIDEKGNVYRADPFQGDHPFWTSIPPGGKESGWMAFEAVPRGTKSLRLVIPDVFTMKVPPWTVEVEFPL